MQKKRLCISGVVIVLAALMAGPARAQPTQLPTVSQPVGPIQVFLQPSVILEINQTSATTDDYVNWSPTPCRIRLRSLQPGPVPVTLVNRNPAVGGQVRFAAGILPPGTTATADTLALTLPADQSWVLFSIAGKFGFPSVADKDAVIEAHRNTATGPAIGNHALMVRIRKNANTLTEEERHRFLKALISVSDQLLYQVHQDIHAIAGNEAHGFAAFLPWHRAFVLRLERELQSFDPAVALPYWRFDQAAPNVFDDDFMGGPPIVGGFVTLAPGNPIATWTSEGVAGIFRNPGYAPTGAPSLLSETSTLALGGGSYAPFRNSMENNPHGQAHVQTGGPSGWLRFVDQAVRDPLFFLLHSNVDRLWAKWQWTWVRFTQTDSLTYAPQGAHPGSGSIPLGHYLLDTMWPWNGITSPGDPTRPPTAPGGPFPQVVPGAPPPWPRPYDLIEYRFLDANNPAGMGFSYDDVPFQ